MNNQHNKYPCLNCGHDTDEDTFKCDRCGYPNREYWDKYYRM